MQISTAHNIASKEIRCNERQSELCLLYGTGTCIIPNTHARNFSPADSSISTPRFLPPLFPLLSARRRRRPGSAPRREQCPRSDADKSIFTRHNFHTVRPRAPPPPFPPATAYIHLLQRPHHWPPFAEASTIAGSLAAGSLEA